jgi:hypothetical protein
MADAANIATRYIAAWNERDPDRRRALIAELWTPVGTYVDPLVQARGHDEIAGMIGAVQERFAGLVFRRTGRTDGCGDKIRFSWVLGPEDGE